QVAFSPDGRRVLTWSGAGTTLRLWDAATGEPVTPSLAHPARLGGAAFSPDGRWLATTCADGSVWLWDVSPGDSEEREGTRGAAGTREAGDASLRAQEPRSAGTHEVGGWSVSDLLLQAQLQASRRIDATGGSVTLTAGELRRAWRSLRP